MLRRRQFPVEASSSLLERALAADAVDEDGDGYDYDEEIVW